MIRILHYGLSPNVGGIETYLWNLARTIDGELFHLDYLHTDTGRPPAFAEELAARGSRFFPVTARRASARRNWADLERLFSSEEFDILHFHANTASYAAPVRAALRRGTRVVVHSHNAGARSRLTRALHQANRRTLPWGRIARIAVSDPAGRWMFGQRDFQVIPNGIDVERFAFDQAARDRKRADLGIGPDELVVGNVGAFLPAKNHRFILEVFLELQRARPSSRLLLVGDGPLRAAVEQAVRDRDLAARVSFLGRREDIPELLWAMDALLMPSLFEGFGIAALEAEATGLPCVLSDHFPAEVVLGPTCHRLALGAGPEVWAAALSAALSEVRSGDRRDGATAVIDAGFTVAANTAAVESLYDRLMRSGA